MAMPAYTNAGQGNRKPSTPLLYYITDRRQFGGSEAEQQRSLLAAIGRAGRAGVDYIQLRERDLSGRALEELARKSVAVMRDSGSSSRLLINSRVDVALAVGADGVHLRGDDLFASEARAIARARSDFLVAVSCHSTAEVKSAWSHGADFAVFGPVFEKNGRIGTSVEGLREACAATPAFVLALGGVTPDNAGACMKAGAVGMGGIRLFQQAKDLQALVRELRR